jgi:alpha-1,4-digalacturonate transport system permease protein
MATPIGKALGAAVAAPVIWLASAVNLPLKALQKATGINGMAAFFPPRTWRSSGCSC